MNRGTARVGMLALMAVAGAFAGCGSSDSCEDTKTCSSSAAGADGSATGGTAGTGSGGTSGTAGSGGSSGSSGSSGSAGSGGAAGGAGSSGASGSSGSAGTGGAAGGAGVDGGSDADAGPECNSDGDCDDGVACNGAEQCVEGSCVPGTPVVCTNPDATHCAVGTCVESDGGADCPVTALDKDNDGHADKLCAASPGDDCNDNNKNVHPGATEICNGIDDDCDGKTDLDDGLALAGTNAALVAGSYDAGAFGVAWSPVSNVFGVAWTDNRSGTDQVYYEAMSTAGAPLSTATALYTVFPTQKAQGNPRIAWGATKFGIVWRDEDKSGVAFESISSDGVSKSAVVTVGAGGYAPDIAWDDTTQQFIVVWQTVGGAVLARAVKQDGTLGASALTVQGTQVSSTAAVAASGGIVGVAWEQSADSTLKSSWARFATLTGAPALQGAVNVTTNTPPDGTFNSYPSLAGITGGFAHVWHPSTSLLDTTNSYEERKADRSLACGPLTLDNEYFIPSIAAYASGTVVVAPSKGASSFDVVMQRIATGCKKSGAPVPIASGTNLVTGVAYGAGKGFAVLWLQQNSANNHYEIWRRTFGPLFCN